MQEFSIEKLSKGLKNKDFSSVELTKYFLEKIANSDLNSFITVTDELAIEQAIMADKNIAKGDTGILTGIPYAHKDIFCTNGIKTSAGSKILDSFISPYDATVSHKLNLAGSVMLGKANMDEMAMGSSNENSFYGAVKNPWNKNKTPGGSSGGSAATVAAELCSFATGTDTGGSIRQPASFCGVTGIKPTYGRVSRYGMIAYASSLDQAGVLTQTALDAALVLQSIAGFDEKDSTSVDISIPDYTKDIKKSIKGLKIGIPKEFFSNGLDKNIAQILISAIKEFEKMGAKIVEISLENSKYAIPTYYIIAPCECSSNLSRFDGVRYGYCCKEPKDIEDLYLRSRSEGFGAEVKRRIIVGTYALSAGYYDQYYLKAQKVRRLISQDFEKAFKDVDVIMGPVSPNIAPDLGSFTDSISMYLTDIYTLPLNLAGLPGVSIPVGFVDNMPVGLQIMGKHWSESLLLNTAHQFQMQTDWHLQKPKED